MRRRVDDVNDHSSRLLADNISISPETIKILEALNTRHKQLETAIVHRIQALENALRDFGPSSQHFLQGILKRKVLIFFSSSDRKVFFSGSVVAPWERSISSNRVPYYIKWD